MLKLPQKLGRGIAFWREIDQNTFLGTAYTYVQVGRFESLDRRLRQTNEIYRGDTAMPLAADVSEANYEITINGMQFTVPDPALTSQYPQGLWSIFDLFAINYVYQYGAYNLTTYSARTYHFGPKAMKQQPLGQLLVRAFGGNYNRVYEMEFYMVKSGDIEMPLSGTEFQKTSVVFVPLVNPSYTGVDDPEGLWFSLRDFPQSIANLGIGM